MLNSMNRAIKQPNCLFAGQLISLLLFATSSMADSRTPEAFIDTHLHYNAAHAAHFDAAEIITRLQANGVAYGVVTSTPTEHSLALYRESPQRIIPLLGAYRTLADKSAWLEDNQLVSRLAAQLKQGHWRGIGELHLFASQRHRPVFRQLIELARSHRLPLLLHTDPVVIDSVYQQAPELRLIWAHGGTFAYPDLLADYLQRYPQLMIDLSVRDTRIAPQGELDDAWYQLFIQYPDRFLLGVDTFAVARWQNYSDALASIRQWLAQLPEEVAQQMAYQNAIKVYDIEKTTHKQAQ